MADGKAVMDSIVNDDFTTKCPMRMNNRRCGNVPTCKRVHFNDKGAPKKAVELQRQIVSSARDKESHESLADIESSVKQLLGYCLCQKHLAMIKESTASSMKFLSEERGIFNKQANQPTKSTGVRHRPNLETSQSTSTKAVSTASFGSSKATSSTATLGRTPFASISSNATDFTFRHHIPIKTEDDSGTSQTLSTAGCQSLLDNLLQRMETLEIKCNAQDAENTKLQSRVDEMDINIRKRKLETRDLKKRIETLQSNSDKLLDIIEELKTASDNRQGDDEKLQQDREDLEEENAALKAQLRARR